MTFIVFYDLVFILVSFFFLIKYFFRGRLNLGVFERLKLPKDLLFYLRGKDRPIWFHGVSVGEVASLKGLIESLKNIYPEKPFLISTITPQGKELAHKLYGGSAFIFYLPLDLSFIMKKLVKIINPSILLVVETEIWPNLFYFLRREAIPIIILNGRISPRSFKFYRLAKPLLNKVLEAVTFVASQDELSSQRFLSLGLKPSKIRVTGNMKFRVKTFSWEKLSEFREGWQRLVKEKELLFVAGSTHPPEEEIVLDTYKSLKESFPYLRLLICPRHIERSPKISQMAEKFGFKPFFLSRLGKERTWEFSQNSVFILDTVGELVYFYSLADIVFVGGSLAKYGGHNILEPAYFSKPIIFGRHMFNFEEIRRVFLEAKACIEVKDKKEFKEALLKLIENESLREELGRRARFVLNNSQNALEENLKITQSYLR